MGIREQGGLDASASRYDAEHSTSTIRELERQFERGELSRHAYFEKKQALVRLFLKATTQPRRRRRVENYDGD
ncbi:hypothetical protein [Leucobacter ruminantium]|uniref:Uncharacterized protein n=1 Tax=Leucobacter ruminantium TaxID=1289170 RepID=A0A939RWS3_9MICO|nr:hypothetical protein [Leucobacter ruminantium]MBO1803963.1 hypothetical protein [Leucobacter ruminantium]